MISRHLIYSPPLVALSRPRGVRARAAASVVTLPLLFLASQEPAASQEHYPATSCCQEVVPAEAQDVAPDSRQLTLDASLFGLAIGYARRTSPSRLVGGELGLGGDWVNFTPFAGAHFSQAVAYEERDDYGGRGAVGDAACGGVRPL